ncbi:MAG: hypothetical protein IJS32_08680 [Kiritimatiellae bacterium]|nr:hypothetical protein [Kiritimatiellia bacterium]
MILSEADALELIRQEFAKVGVILRRNCEITGFTRTVPDTEERDQDNEPHSRRYPAKQIQASWNFDFASEDGSLAIEFLTMQDETRESFWKDRWARSVISHDLPELAQRLRGDFATRTEGDPVAIGLFFDPLPRTTVWDPERKKNIPRPGSSFAALSEEERSSLDREKRRELLLRDARELLREQVRFFLDWAQREGRLPAPAPEG